MDMSTTRREDSSQDSPMTNPEFREQLRELPPSSKLVARVLEGSAPLAQGQLAEKSLLPGRTVRYALKRLEEADLADSRYSFKDARKHVYFLVN